MSKDALSGAFSVGSAPQVTARGSGLPGGSFRWIVGIENAFIPDMDVDELGWTRHRTRWREDLALAVEVGADAIRYGITWPEVETSPGRYDWSRVDKVVEECSRLGLEPIWDLVHFGVPAYLQDGYLDAAFPAAFAAYAEAFAKRYSGIVSKVTPWNEPYISTYFRAGWGIWPPYLKGREGFATLFAPLITALHDGIGRMRAVAPTMQVWLNDGADSFHPVRPAVAAEAAFRTLQRYAPFDVLLGLAVPGNETHDWLVAAGFPRDTLERLAQAPVHIDVLGLDYYPDTEHDFDVDANGRTHIVKATNPSGLAATALAYHQRYQRPLFVAESSTSGTDAERRAWLDWNVAEIAKARAQGVDVLGYTWWPLFDHIDWNTLLQERTGFVCPAGLYHLTPTTADRTPTAAVDEFRLLARGVGAEETP